MPIAQIHFSTPICFACFELCLLPAEELDCLTPTCPAATAEAEGAGEVILEAPGVKSINQSMIGYLSEFRNTLRYLLTFRCSLFLFSFPFCFASSASSGATLREERLRCQRIFDLPEGWVGTGFAYSQNVPCETKRYCSVFA